MTEFTIPRGIIVSCQAPEGTPLRRPGLMALMAQAAELGGAVAIRAEGAEDIAGIAAATALPVIGLRKVLPLEADRVYITPSLADAAEVVRAGARVVALDGTARPRSGNADLRTVIAGIHDRLGAFVMADVDGVESAEYAQKCGADMLGTTLVGYTSATAGDAHDTIDLDVLSAITAAASVPVLAEGKVWSREDAMAAFERGAYAVVVGSAITNPLLSTRRYARAVARYTV